MIISVSGKEMLLILIEREERSNGTILCRGLKCLEIKKNQQQKNSFEKVRRPEIAIDKAHTLRCE